jgi:hypothetical protein
VHRAAVRGDRIRRRAEGLNELRERVRTKGIVGIENDDDLAASLLDTAVDGIGLPQTRCADRPDLGECRQNRQCRVAAAAVDDNMFDVGVRLRTYALDRLAEKGGGVERRRNDRYYDAPMRVR